MDLDYQKTNTTAYRMSRDKIIHDYWSIFAALSRDVYARPAILKADTARGRDCPGPTEWQPGASVAVHCIVGSCQFSCQIQ